ncbi:MAG: hypothetical protein ACK4GL_05380 [Flavobacteriales bacterium]
MSINESQQQENKLIAYLKQNKNFSAALAIILILIFWMFINSLGHRKAIKAQQQKLQETIQIYEHKLDSLNQNGFENMIRIFAWSVRSELLRNNMEEVSRYSNELLQYNGIQKISLVDPSTRLITFSTDKKEEGQSAMETVFVDIPGLRSKRDGNQIQLILPVMGVDRKLAILMVESSL